jgi:hypothetical protein
MRRVLCFGLSFLRTSYSVVKSCLLVCWEEEESSKMMMLPFSNPAAVRPGDGYYGVSIPDHIKGGMQFHILCDDHGRLCRVMCPLGLKPGSLPLVRSRGGRRRNPSSRRQISPMGYINVIIARHDQEEPPRQPGAPPRAGQRGLFARLFGVGFRSPFRSRRREQVAAERAKRGMDSRSPAID